MAQHVIRKTCDTVSPNHFKMLLEDIERDLSSSIAAPLSNIRNLQTFLGPETIVADPEESDATYFVLPTGRVVQLAVLLTPAVLFNVRLMHVKDVASERMANIVVDPITHTCRVNGAEMDLKGALVLGRVAAYKALPGLASNTQPSRMRMRRSSSLLPTLRLAGVSDASRGMCARNVSLIDEEVLFFSRGSYSVRRVSLLSGWAHLARERG